LKKQYKSKLGVKIEQILLVTRVSLV